MDTVKEYQRIVKSVLINLTQIPYSHGDITFETIFDNESNRFILMILGRRDHKRVHSCIAHIDIVDDEVWIQRDGTEQGLANDLINAGIPKNKIVLGFRSSKVRKDVKVAS